MRKKTIVKNIGKKYKVFTEYGIFDVFLSSSIASNFSIGNVNFEAIGGIASNGYKPDKPIPASWAVDISIN
jgi:hypothetical protein